MAKLLGYHVYRMGGSFGKRIAIWGKANLYPDCLFPEEQKAAPFMMEVVQHN